MTEPLNPDPTVDLAPTPDALDAGLAAAFAPDSGPALPAGASVLKALAAGLPSVPNVHLRDAEGEPPTPVVRTGSSELPTGAEPTGRLLLLGEIARGGMGAILKGRDTDLGRDVAVKVLLETHHGKTELVQRFVEEAQIAGQLQHPGVVPVYELGQFSDLRPYFTMKLVKGKTLAGLLAARKKPAEDLSRFIGVFGQVCQTLAYAHARGVIHRDLKPSNVMVGTFGEVQVMDWGLAKVLREGGVADERKEQTRPDVSVIRTQRSAPGTPEIGSDTQAGSVLGTPAYMSPEQACGDVELIDERADVFGLGAILCVILTGQPPFVGRDPEAARKAQKGRLDEAYARLDGCGAEAELVALAKHCLAPEMWERPRDAGKVAEAVTAYQNSVADRLRKAELAHAAEVARAEEAQATAAQECKVREAALAKAAAERRARRMTAALAASVLLAVILGAAGWRWVELERITRTAALNARVSTALQEAVRLRGQAQGAVVGDLTPWAVAVAAARKADALLEPGVHPDLRQQTETVLAEVIAEEHQAETAVRASERDRRLLDQVIDIRCAKADDRDGTATDAAYAGAFREAGIDVAGLPPAEAGSKLGARPAAVALAAALDDWAAVRRDLRKDIPGAKRLSEAAQVADPDPWRRDLRTAVGQPDKEARLTALRALVGTARFDELGAISLDLLGVALKDAGDKAASEKVLREAQRRHPGDVWVNFDLGTVLTKRGRTEEAIRYYTAARAIRPETAHQFAHALQQTGASDEAILVFQDLVRLRPQEGLHFLCLAKAFMDSGRLPEATKAYDAAVAVLREQTKLTPDLAWTHSALGAALAGQGKLDDAFAEYREAMRLKPDFAGPHYYLACDLQDLGKHQQAVVAFREAIQIDAGHEFAFVKLGRSLKALGKLDEAVAAFREAVRVGPDMAQGHANLAWGLGAQGKYDEAIAANREAVRHKPDYAEAYLNLSEGLRRKGQYAEALAQMRTGHDLGSKRLNWRIPSAELVRQAEQMLEMDGMLPAFLKGEYKPSVKEKRIALAEVCFAKKLPGAAVILYTDAFTADPMLADDRQADHLYNAACAAALAGAATVEGDSTPDGENKAKLRQQARGWIQLERAANEKLLTSKNPRARVEVLERLQRWKSDPNLAGIRDDDAVAKLSADEREACKKLWADVAELLKKADIGNESRKEP